MTLWLISISTITILLLMNFLSTRLLFLTTLIIGSFIHGFFNLIVRYILFNLITFILIIFLDGRILLFFFGVGFTFSTAASIFRNFGRSNCRCLSFLLW